MTTTLIAFLPQLHQRHLVIDSLFVPKFDIEHHDPPNVSLNQSTPIPDSNCLMPVVCDIMNLVVPFSDQA